MYARFFRWASDRIDENGIIAFVSNSSFINARTFDGFRKEIALDFNEIWIIDLKGDAHTSGERRRKEGGNIFHDQIRVGIAIYFCVKKFGAKGCRIRYQAVRDYAKAEEKLEFVTAMKLEKRHFEEIRPDYKNNWIDIANNDFDSLVVLADKETKSNKKGSDKKAIFRLFSLGVVTARDDWVYDFDRKQLESKVKTLIETYNADVKKWRALDKKERRIDALDASIKWTRAVKNDLRRERQYKFWRGNIVEAIYRPFVKNELYFEKHLNEMQYQLNSIFLNEPNPTIAFLCVHSSNLLATLVVNQPFDYCLLKMGNGGTQSVPRWYYDSESNRHDNITDWSLELFRGRYNSKLVSAQPVTKDAIFNYVYAVLNDPIYREKYALNLRREFPRIPFYDDFWRWANWGEKLMALHMGYEAVDPWPLARIDRPNPKVVAAGQKSKPILRANHDHGIIVLDSETQLSGVPAKAWAYKLGNRSALEWILDQHKEKKPKDPTIREKFNTYRFADYKEEVIDLLRRVTRVSVETMAIVEAMRATPR